MLTKLILKNAHLNLNRNTRIIFLAFQKGRYKHFEKYQQFHINSRKNQIELNEICKIS